MRAVAVVVVAVVVLAAIAPLAEAQEVVQRRGFSIRITSPVSQEDFVLGKTKITAEVEAPSAKDVERVEFLVGDQVIFVDREAPWECFYDFGEESKSWVIRAVAYHTSGVSVGDVSITRKLDIAHVEEVNRVILWATVTDRDDALVTELEKDDFRVLEDGTPQEILEFYPEDRAITLAILIDTSQSMADQMKEVHEAAGAFVDTLRDEDRALVIDFDDKVFLVQDLTNDREALKETIRGTEALGGTAIYDALHAAFRKLRGIEGRKAIILLSDGDDSASQFGYERVVEETKAENVLLYSIGIGSANRRVLKEFSDVTGGRAWFVNKASELAGVYQRIALELRRQYYLTYSTSISTWDGRWVKVGVEHENPDYSVRARRGYFAVRGSGRSSDP